MNYLPGKKFRTVLIILLALAIILLILSLPRSGKIAFQSKERAFLPATGEEFISLQDIMEKDTDGDGLLDWEETLWELDPNKKDSDDDGLEDNSEVAARREEIKKQNRTEADENKETYSPEPINETDLFAREFFATVVALNQSGRLDQDTLKNLSEYLSQNITEAEIPDLFAPADLELVNSSPATAKNYWQTMSRITSEHDAEIGRELEIISQAIRENNSGPLIELAEVAAAYESFAQAASRIAVPADIAEPHLKLINHYVKTAISIRKMEEIFENPIAAVGGLRQYRLSSQEISQVALDLGTYFEENDII